MSRETDTPSSGPNGRGGGAAYPSGTPPYGTPAASDAGSDTGRSAERPEERKTETTLTTRIRINIPGSRPIPPVVVRTPVADAGTSEETGETELPTAAPGAATATVDAPADPAQSAEDKTSDWFAPRKSGPAKGGPGSGATNGAGLPGGSAAGTPGAGAPGASSGGARPGAGASGGARPGGVVGSMSVPGGSRAGGANGRPGGTNGAGLPGATGGPVAPGHGGGTGSFDVTEALAAGPLGNGGTRAGGEPRRDELPYFSDNDPAQHNGHPDQNGFADPSGQNGGFGGAGGQNGQGGFAGQDGLGGQPGYGGQDGLNGQNGYGGSGTQNGFAGPAQDNGFGGPGGDPFAGPGGPAADNFAGPGGTSGFNGPNGRGGQRGQGGSQGPAGPTGGPVTGDGPLVPPLGPGGPGALPGGESFGPGGPGQVPGGPGAPRTARGGAPAGLGMAPGAPGTAGTGLGPGGGLSDDTAILTPQKPAPEPGTPGYPTPDNVSGHTVTSGIPVVPPGAKSPFGPGGSTDGPLPHTPPKLPEPVAQNVPAAAAPKKKKKGRSKLVLLAGVLVVAGVGVYGAGLLMNHSDVPKGTTVLGVDIGGGTRDDAVKKLDAAFGSRVNKPLKLSVGGKTVPLTPDQAGLQFDEQATVAKAATSDYNPVSVVGSLFGQHRVIDPVMPVDEEKLAAALKSAVGGGSGSGSVTDGTIEFKSGKAVAVYGKGGKGIDAAKSAQAVEEAYRSQVETGTTAPVAVVTTGQQPTVSNAEVDREMKAFAQPAMSANVTVKTDTGKQIEFSPQNSLWKFLRVKAVGGKLVDSPDLNALKELYGQTFDGVLITRGTGQKTAVTPQDVYVALRQALLSKTNRVGIIQTNPS